MLISGTWERHAQFGVFIRHITIICLNYLTKYKIFIWNALIMFMIVFPFLYESFTFNIVNIHVPYPSMHVMGCQIYGVV